MTPWKSHLCGTMALPSPWLYYPLPRICVPFLPSVDPPLRYYDTPLTLLAVALFTEVELPATPDHLHDHIPLHGTH
ncbi:hypothetical protein BHM03_00004771 [Ensete ventricosum]|nr:hypothetical protein BHM03_00004771 [Ensete ventricosum]